MCCTLIGYWRRLYTLSMMWRYVYILFKMNQFNQINGQICFISLSLTNIVKKLGISPSHHSTQQMISPCLSLSLFHPLLIEYALPYLRSCLANIRRRWILLRYNALCRQIPFILCTVHGCRRRRRRRCRRRRRRRC